MKHPVHTEEQFNTVQTYVYCISLLYYLGRNKIHIEETEALLNVC